MNRHTAFLALALGVVPVLGDRSMDAPGLIPSLLDGDLGIAPVVSIARDGADLVLNFAGTLQAAPAPDGPWSDVPGALSPFREGARELPRFFRSRVVDGVFDTQAVASFGITGPLQEHFELAFAGMPDGIFPPIRPKPYFDAIVGVDGQDIPVTLRVRGNSSLQECPFPKLKFKVSRTRREGTPFSEAREIKVGTHCAEGGRGGIGRLREETATFREALAYEVMDLLGFVTPRVRRAQIEYHDTSPPLAESTRGWTLSRKALILDDADVVAEQRGGRALTEEEIRALTDARFDEQLILDLRVLHVLLGNWDFALSVDGRNLWNTDVLELPGGVLVPVAGDFDLASWVTENVLDSVPHDYHPELPMIDRRARYELEQIQRSAPADAFAAAGNRVLQKQAALENLVRTAVVDEPGRTNAARHLDAFFQAWAAVSRR